VSDAFVRDEIVNFIQVVEHMARGGYAEYSVGQLESATGLSKTQLRGVLHSGRSRGWFRPCFDEPEGRIKRWALAERVPHLAESYRVALIDRARDLDEQFQRLIEAPSRPRWDDRRWRLDEGD